MSNTIIVIRKTRTIVLKGKERLDDEGYLKCDGCKFASWNGNEVKCSGNAKTCPEGVK